MAVDKIAEQLNAEGIKPRAGVRWHATSVRRVLLAAYAM